MIFVTVGGQLPFDRMVDVVDRIAEEIDEPIFGQIGKTSRVPRNFEAVKFLSPQEFNARFSEARVVIGHAGIGTILTAQQLRKPVLLMSRRAAFGEHRNDHQLATVEQLRHIPGVYIFEDAEELLALLQQTDLRPAGEHASSSKSQLIDFLRSEISR